MGRDRELQTAPPCGDLRTIPFRRNPRDDRHKGSGLNAQSISDFEEVVSEFLRDPWSCEK